MSSGLYRVHSRRRRRGRQVTRPFADGRASTLAATAAARVSVLDLVRVLVRLRLSLPGRPRDRLRRGDVAKRARFVSRRSRSSGGVARQGVRRLGPPCPTRLDVAHDTKVGSCGVSSEGLGPNEGLRVDHGSERVVGSQRRVWRERLRVAVPSGKAGNGTLIAFRSANRQWRRLGPVDMVAKDGFEFLGSTAFKVVKDEPVPSVLFRRRRGRAEIRVERVQDPREG